MPKRREQKAVDRTKFLNYQKVAEHFYNAAKDSLELEYRTASGVLIVHSAIAFADAVCIKLSGQRSSSDNHEETIDMLSKVIIETENNKKAIIQLRRIIEEKTKVSYLGELYSQSSIKELFKRLKRFHDWAEEILER